MELRHLQALDAVLRTGSFTAAAAARHISQPALWAQVKDLEHELGLQLFARAGRGIAPTAACDALRDSLNTALDDVAKLQHIAAQIRDGAAAPARIGCAPSFVGHFLAGSIRAVREQNPQAPFPVVVPVTTGSAISALMSRRVDLLVEPRSRVRGVSACKLYDVSIWVLGPATRRARAGCIELKELAGEAIVSLPGDSLLRRTLNDIGARANVGLQFVHETRDARALIELAAQGVCTAIVHDEILDDRTARRAARLTHQGRALTHAVWLSWRTDQELSPAARTLRDTMRERARKLPES